MDPNAMVGSALGEGTCRDCGSNVATAFEVEFHDLSPEWQERINAAEELAQAVGLLIDESKSHDEALKERLRNRGLSDTAMGEAFGARMALTNVFKYAKQPLAHYEAAREAT